MSGGGKWIHASMKIITMRLMQGGGRMKMLQSILFFWGVSDTDCLENPVKTQILVSITHNESSERNEKKERKDKKKKAK